MIRARVDESSSHEGDPDPGFSGFGRQLGELDGGESVPEAHAELSPGRLPDTGADDAFMMNAASRSGRRKSGGAKRGAKQAAKSGEDGAAVPDEMDGEEPEDGDGGEAEPLPSLESNQLQGAIEAILFSTGEPVTIRQLAEVFEVSVHEIRETVEAIRSEFDDSGRAFNLVEIGGGLQFLTRPSYHPWVSRFRHKRKSQRLSAAALETLAVIAYKQPISKADLESIRGVQCSPILKTLLDRDLVKIVGREDTLGKPLLYGTTQSFLENFGLGSIQQLPEPEVEGAPAEASEKASET